MSRPATVPAPVLQDGTRVRLHAFNGSTQPPAGVRDAENYWRLIGQAGTVLGYEPALGRYLVQLDVDVQALGLHCHNPVRDSLYLRGADLVPQAGTQAPPP